MPTVEDVRGRGRVDAGELPNRESRGSILGSATARACANVALVKYWGKRDEALNLPATGSISVTLGGLQATARVEAAAGGAGARFVQDGVAVGGLAGERMAEFLDLLSRASDAAPVLRVDVEANFPVGAGLASSAAIYCAVAAAGASLCGLRMSLAELSAVARRGSGSAARSVYGGWVEWQRGQRADGGDSTAVQLLEEHGWPIGVAVAVVSDARKAIASRDAMRHVVESSPLFAGWVAAQEGDLAEMRRAIGAQDLDRVGRVAEENCLRMHATAIAARPPVLYWTPVTVAVMQAVHELRSSGVPAYFTIDAGPQVKVLCRLADLAQVRAALAATPGVLRVIESRPGPGVAMVEGHQPWS